MQKIFKLQNKVTIQFPAHSWVPEDLMLTILIGYTNGIL